MVFSAGKRFDLHMVVCYNPPRMKNLLLILMLGCMALAGEKVTLETKLVSASEEESSLYLCPDSVRNHLGSSMAQSEIGRKCELTFYVDVDKLYGAHKLKKGKRYRLDSLSWHGHPAGLYTGEGRRVVISNGDDEMSRQIPATSSDRVTIRQRKTKNPFTFTSSDILEVTLRWEGDKNACVAIRFYDAPPAPARISGTAFNLVDDDELNDGDASQNVYVRQWRYNCPAIRIRATLDDTLDIRQIGMIGGGLVLLLLLLKLTIFRRKKRTRES